MPSILDAFQHDTFQESGQVTTYIEQALLTYLKAVTALTALIGKRIYYDKAPQDVAAPYIVFFKVSSQRPLAHDGDVHFARDRFQFSIFARTFYLVVQIAGALYVALQGKDGIIGDGAGVRVGGIRFLNETDMPFETETELYHRPVDFEVPHEE